MSLPNWDEMTYDEQRAFLGLWQPTFGFHWHRATRSVVDAFAPIIQGFAEVFKGAAAAVPSDYGVVGEK